MGSNNTKYDCVAIYSRFVLYRTFFYWIIITILEKQLKLKTKIWNEIWSWGWGWGGSTSGNNVTNSFSSLNWRILFFLLLYPESLHTDHFLYRKKLEIFTIVWVSMKFVKICHPRKLISAKLFKTGQQQKFMSKIFSNFVIVHHIW